MPVSFVLCWERRGQCLEAELVWVVRKRGQVVYKRNKGSFVRYTSRTGDDHHAGVSSSLSTVSRYVGDIRFKDYIRVRE